MSNIDPVQDADGTLHERVTVIEEDGVRAATVPEARTTVRQTTTVAQDPQRVQARRVRRGVTFTVNLIAILIVIRIILALLGANPESIFAAIIYALTGVLTFPFQGLFGAPTVPTVGVPVFEASNLVAISIYYLIGWIVLRIHTLRSTPLATTHTEVTDRELRVKP